MKKLSFSILLGIFGFLSIYESSDVDFTKVIFILIMKIDVKQMLLSIA